MAHRLHVTISAELDARLSKAAQRSRVSKSEWARQALEEALRPPKHGAAAADPLARLASLNAPTADIDRMLAEIDVGRH